MIRLRLIAGLLLAWLPAFAGADNAPPCEYAATFTQSRMVEGLPVPLRSSGNLLVACNQGLVWQTIEPVQQSVIYTTGSNHFRLADDSQLELLDDLVNKNMAGMLIPMLSGNLDSLKAQFEIVEAGSTITMTPRDATTARFLKQIEVYQQPDGAVVEIRDGSDLKTTIAVNELQPLDVVDLDQCQQSLSTSGPVCEALLFPDQTAAGLVSDR